MKAKLKRAPLPDGAKLRRLIAERAGELVEGAKLVDPDAQGATGVDLLLVDEEGRPVFVDIVGGNATDVPTRIFDHLDWLGRNRRLFTRAYADDGVVKCEEPFFVFVASGFPPAAVKAVRAIGAASARLVRMESFVVDGEAELLLEDVQQEPRRQGERSQVMRDTGKSEEEPPGREVEIQSDEVQSLLALFRSGVDGLDGRVRERRADGGIDFELDGRTLAFVSASPASFTVSPGDRLANPIVVSDRVSLERALNAVVSLFVREYMGSQEAERVEPGAPGLSDEERAELAAVWGSGVAGGDAG